MAVVSCGLEQRLSETGGLGVLVSKEDAEERCCSGRQEGRPVWCGAGAGPAEEGTGAGAPFSPETAIVIVLVLHSMPLSLTRDRCSVLQTHLCQEETRRQDKVVPAW